MDMLDLYSDYLIFQNKYATATGLSDLVDGAFAHVAIKYKLIVRANQIAWQELKKWLLKIDRASHELLIRDRH